MNCIILNNEPISAFIQESLLHRTELLSFCGKYDCIDTFFKKVNQPSTDIDLVILSNEMYLYILSEKKYCDSFLFSTLKLKYLVLFDKYAVLEKDKPNNFKNVHFYNAPICVEDIPTIVNQLKGQVVA